MKHNVLVISKGIIHPSFLSRKTLKFLLRDLRANYSLHFTNRLEALKKLNNANQVKGSSKTNYVHYKAAILYYHAKSASEEALNALFDYVENGGSVLALHSSMASFKNNKEYQEMLGGKFASHGKIENVKVYPLDNTHPILNGVREFTVKDELYIHEYQQNNTILLSTNNKGQEEPIMWIKTYGKGKVCYFAPGHCPNVWLNAEVKKLLNNALIWLCDEKV